ncbi:MAG: helix-turn-helix domain-containing protein [Pseudomonadota bacterium]
MEKDTEKSAGDDGHGARAAADQRRPLLLTTDEVALMLRLSAETVRRLHRAGRLQAVPHLRKLLFRPSEVEAFMRGAT